jgi:hypothetical protein
MKYLQACFYLRATMKLSILIGIESWRQQDVFAQSFTACPQAVFLATIPLLG